MLCDFLRLHTGNEDPKSFNEFASFKKKAFMAAFNTTLRIQSQDTWTSDTDPYPAK